MTLNEMRRTLDLALKDRAPKAYRQMKNRGQLATYLDSLSSEAMESVSVATSKAASELPGLPKSSDPMRNVQVMNMARKTAEEVALAQALEAMPMEHSEDETAAEPMSLYDLTSDESLLTSNRTR